MSKSTCARCGRNYVLMIVGRLGGRYCRPCWRVIQKIRAANGMKG